MNDNHDRFLTDSELKNVTGKSSAAAQRRALDHMHISYFMRPDGKPVVAFEAITGTRVVEKGAQPNWGAI
jgi:hypothetical protein